MSNPGLRSNNLGGSQSNVQLPTFSLSSFTNEFTAMKSRQTKSAYRRKIRPAARRTNKTNTKRPPRRRNSAQAKIVSNGSAFTRKKNSRPCSIPNGGKSENLQNTETPPSLCQWVFERITEAGISPHTILDPCAGRGHLTRLFRPRSQVIEYDITNGRDFFRAKHITCDLVICNPPWKEPLRWLKKIVQVVGVQTPIVFICPALFLSGHKMIDTRKYLDCPSAPILNHFTPLPKDTFVSVYCFSAIFWFNLPELRNVAFVPSSYLIRSNDWLPSRVGDAVASYERQGKGGRAS